MNNCELLKQMLQDAATDPTTTHETLKTAMLTSIAGSLAIIADIMEKEGVDDGKEKDPASGS